MKKILSLLLAFSLALSLAACGGSASSAASSAAVSEVASSAAASEEEETAAPLSATEPLRIAGLKGPTTMGLVNLLSMEQAGTAAMDYDLQLYGAADEIVPLLIKGELDITVPVSRAYTGSGKISARPEQLFFSESGMPGTILFSTFLGDFIEYEVQLNDGQNLIVNEYTKDTTEIHSDGEQVHLSFDPMRISLYDKSEEVLSL